MLNFKQQFNHYLDYCQYQKALNAKTLKAYKIDINQFWRFLECSDGYLSKSNLSEYAIYLHKTYKPKTVKRKIASIKAFCRWLEYEEVIQDNPFLKIDLKFHEPRILPKTIPLDVIQKFLQSAYRDMEGKNDSPYQRFVHVRNIAVVELLFASGMRVSELCSLKIDDINLESGQICIFGKGSKERIITIGNPDVLIALKNYQTTMIQHTLNTTYFF